MATSSRQRTTSRWNKIARRWYKNILEAIYWWFLFTGFLNLKRGRHQMAGVDQLFIKNYFSSYLEGWWHNQTIGDGETIMVRFYWFWGFLQDWFCSRTRLLSDRSRRPYHYNSQVIIHQNHRHPITISRPSWSLSPSSHWSWQSSWSYQHSCRWTCKGNQGLAL